MAPPLPTNNVRMTSHDYARLNKISFYGSRHFIFTGSCSATHELLLSAFKRKLFAARFALTAEMQASSTKVHSIGTTEPIRTAGTSAQTSPFISLA